MAPTDPGSKQGNPQPLNRDDIDTVVLSLAYTSLKQPKLLLKCESAARKLDSHLLFHALRARIANCPHCAGEEPKL